jgi:hypothetical protein
LRNEAFQNSSKLLEIEMFYRGADAVTKILADLPADDVLKQISMDGTLLSQFVSSVRGLIEIHPRHGTTVILR